MSGPRGPVAALAALAAVLLSIAALAGAPGTGLAGLAGQRVVALADDCAGAAQAAPHSAGGSPLVAAVAVPAASPRAALAARAALMLRHTSLPPPARA
jgi:hypothetical protein